MDGPVDELIQVPAFVLASELGLQFRVQSFAEKQFWCIIHPHYLGGQSVECELYAEVFLCQRLSS